MITIRKILFPTDFSDNSRLAIPFVREYTQTFSAEIHVLHVLEPMVTTTDFTWAGLNFAELEEKRRAGAREAMTQLVEELGLPAEQVVTAVERGKTYEVVRQYVGGHEIDLVILSTHGHRGLTHLLLGSTAEMVVRTAPCPVLTVKSSLYGEPNGESGSHG